MELLVTGPVRLRQAPSNSIKRSLLVEIPMKQPSALILLMLTLNVHADVVHRDSIDLDSMEELYNCIDGNGERVSIYHAPEMLYACRELTCQSQSFESVTSTEEPGAVRLEGGGKVSILAKFSESTARIFWDHQGDVVNMATESPKDTFDCTR